MSDAEAAARRLLASATPRTLALPERDIEIALLDWGGDGPPALLHHANGFCAGLWGGVADRLRSHFRLIAMDARGHDDGVGIDEMVAYEYAKVRYHYANKLKLPERTEIEWFAGGHEINGKGTFAFLKKHLGYPR